MTLILRSLDFAQPAIACSKLSIETLEQDMKYVQIQNKNTRTTPPAGWKHGTSSFSKDQSFPALVHRYIFRSSHACHALITSLLLNHVTSLFPKCFNKIFLYWVWNLKFEVFGIQWKYISSFFIIPFTENVGWIEDFLQSETNKSEKEKLLVFWRFLVH